MGAWISVFLQAAGILLVLWTVLGFLVGGHDRGGAVVFNCFPGKTSSQETFLRCYLWLRETGLIKMPLFLVDCGLSSEEHALLVPLTRSKPEIRFCTEDTLAGYLRQEASQHGGT